MHKYINVPLLTLFLPTLVLLKLKKNPPQNRWIFMSIFSLNKYMNILAYFNKYRIY